MIAVLAALVSMLYTMLVLMFLKERQADDVWRAVRGPLKGRSSTAGSNGALPRALHGALSTASHNVTAFATWHSAINDLLGMPASVSRSAEC